MTLLYSGSASRESLNFGRIDVGDPPLYHQPATEIRARQDALADVEHRLGSGMAHWELLMDKDAPAS